MLCFEDGLRNATNRIYSLQNEIFPSFLYELGSLLKFKDPAT